MDQIAQRSDSQVSNSFLEFTRHLLYMILKILRRPTLKTVCWTKKQRLNYFHKTSVKSVRLWQRHCWSPTNRKQQAIQTDMSCQHGRLCICSSVAHLTHEGSRSIWILMSRDNYILLSDWSQYWPIFLYSFFKHEGLWIQPLNRHDVGLHQYYWSLLGVFLSWSAITRDEKL